MNRDLKERVELIGSYIKATHSTIRDSAVLFGVSKSTAHLDVSKRLKKYNPKLYHEVKIILNQNFEQKHIRGGESTRKKYLSKK